jgi:hypothetical protein
VGGEEGREGGRKGWGRLGGIAGLLSYKPNFDDESNNFDD